MGVAQWTDTLLKRCGVRTRPRRLVLHYASLLGEQLAAMLPLSLLQIFVLAVFFKKAPDNPGIAAAGLLSAVLGLVLFLDALRLAIMPMAMEVSNEGRAGVKLCSMWRSNRLLWHMTHRKSRRTSPGSSTNRIVLRSPTHALTLLPLSLSLATL